MCLCHVYETVMPREGFFFLFLPSSTTHSYLIVSENSSVEILRHGSQGLLPLYGINLQKEGKHKGHVSRQSKQVRQASKGLGAEVEDDRGLWGCGGRAGGVREKRTSHYAWGRSVGTTLEEMRYGLLGLANASH